MDNPDLKYIKKHYGERFAKLCRECFSSIMEYPGMLAEIITSRFDETDSLYEDVLPNKDMFRSYILNDFYEKVNIKKGIKTHKTPTELMDEAGYILYPECKTEDDIQSFFKYYAYGEELCTFLGGRLNTCRVWFAVKKDVDKIKREDFKNPQREDLYGTSVISIQFTKTKDSILSIKNRYNHRVANPDATFGNNLDNIAPGLTDAFMREYNMNVDRTLNKDFFIDGYVTANNGKNYKKSLTVRDNIYCENNNIINSLNGNVDTFDKAKYLLLDNFLFCFHSKKVVSMEYKDIKDQFVESIGEIKDLKVSYDENKNKVVEITPKNGEKVYVVANKKNEIIKYSNKNVKEIGDNFMQYSKHLKELDMPNVENIGVYCLSRNEDLTNINVPKLTKVGGQFLMRNKELTEVDLPSLVEVGNDFLCDSEKISKINLPNLTWVGDRFLQHNNAVENLDLPKAKILGNNFMQYNNSIKELNLPKVEIILSSCLTDNLNLCCANLPNVVSVGDFFLELNRDLQKLNCPNLKSVGRQFMPFNKNIKIKGKIKNKGNQYEM